MLHHLLSLARTIKHRWNRRKARLDREASSPAVLAFWRDHGRDWAIGDASDKDLDLVENLSNRIATLRRKRQEAEVASLFRQVWEKGFSNAADAFAWDGMNDRLPPAALAAFVEGATSVRREKRSTS